MNKFALTHADLLSFAQKVYQEACYGYYDLCTPITEKLTAEFLNDKETINQEIVWQEFPKDGWVQPSYHGGNFINNNSERI